MIWSKTVRETTGPALLVDNLNPPWDLQGHPGRLLLIVVAEVCFHADEGELNNLNLASPPLPPGGPVNLVLSNRRQFMVSAPFERFGIFPAHYTFRG